MKIKMSELKRIIREVLNDEIYLSVEDVGLDNTHGTEWKLVKVEDYGPETVGRKVFTKYALYKSIEGYKCEYVYDSKSGKWELGNN